MNIGNNVSAMISANYAEQSKSKSNEALEKAVDKKGDSLKIDIQQQTKKDVGVKDDPFKTSVVIKTKDKLNQRVSSDNMSVLLNATDKKQDGLKIDISSIKSQVITKANNGYNKQAENTENMKLSVGGDVSKFAGLSLKI